MVTTLRCQPVLVEWVYSRLLRPALVSLSSGDNRAPLRPRRVARCLYKAQKEFVETNKIGLVFDDINELDDLMKQPTIMRSVRSSAEKRRLNFTIELNISRALDLYRSVLEGGMRTR
ncbi:hypothetical protein [[Eubacterium] cellulosolvens]